MSPAPETGREPWRETLEARLEVLREQARGLQEGLEQLRALTDPAALLAAVPARLGPGTPFSRLAVHAVGASELTALAAWSRDGREASLALLEQLRASPTALTGDTPEAEAIRRRRALLVREPDGSDAGPARVLGAGGYVAAPVIAGSAHPLAVAIVHADRGPEAPVQRADRELVGHLAAASALALERVRLRRTLRHERAALRTALRWSDERSQELAEAPATLGLATTQAARALTELLAAPAAGPVDTLVFDGVLTRRELDVLRLLADGRSNQAIASALVISLGTAKFHVNRILGKLGVANRAEAAARYHALVRASG